jgi:hypothetical protein
MCNSPTNGGGRAITRAARGSRRARAGNTFRSGSSDGRIVWTRSRDVREIAALVLARPLLRAPESPGRIVRSRFGAGDHMRESLHVAFVATDQLARVAYHVNRIFTACGRIALAGDSPLLPRETPLATRPCAPPADVEHWSAVGIRGAPGWTAILTDPPSLLMEGPGPMLAALAAALGAPAFQYNVYDADSHFLFEADGDGITAQSGFVGHDPIRYWGKRVIGPQATLRFQRIDVSATIDAAAGAHPEAADILRMLERGGDTCLSVERVALAVATVFGGASAPCWRREDVIESLLGLAPPPRDGFAVHASPERAVGVIGVD